MAETVMTRRATRHGDDRGYVAAVSALLLIPLMGFVAFAVDLGMWYSDASRIQRAADAAALAGVVALPDLPAATAEARAVALRNGYDWNDPDIDVIVAETGPLQLGVTIVDRDIAIVFSSFFLSDVDITRDSTAQYIKPIPLGSPSNTFGNSSLAEAYNPTPDSAQMWAAINAPWTRRAQGDPFATHCDMEVNDQNACATPNPEFRDTGYWYAIDVTPSMVGTPITVEVFDPIMSTFWGSTQCGGGTCELAWEGFGTTGVTPIVYEVFETDASPYDWHDNTPMNQAGCNQPFIAPPNSSSANPMRNTWVQICQFTPTQVGIYPVNVRATNIPVGGIEAGFEAGGRGQSSQSYSIRATSAGPVQPRLYALGDMSIIVSAPAGPKPQLYLMEISEAYDNKKVEIELFDAGETPGTSFLEFMVPDGAGGSMMAPKCTVTDNVGSTFDLTPCKVMVSNNGVRLYNNQWLKVVIDVGDINPLGPYVCGADCWWRVKYNLATNGATDRTTWRAQVIGDPLALVD